MSLCRPRSEPGRESRRGRRAGRRRRRRGGRRVQGPHRSRPVEAQAESASVARDRPAICRPTAFDRPVGERPADSVKHRPRRGQAAGEIEVAEAQPALDEHDRLRVGNRGPWAGAAHRPCRLLSRFAEDDDAVSRPAHRRTGEVEVDARVGVWRHAQLTGRRARVDAAHAGGGRRGVDQGGEEEQRERSGAARSTASMSQPCRQGRRTILRSAAPVRAWGHGRVGDVVARQAHSRSGSSLTASVSRALAQLPSPFTRVTVASRSRGSVSKISS